LRTTAIDKPPLFSRLVLALVTLLIACFVAWAAIARVDELARGDGKVIPVSKTQIIQSSEAGVVQEIAVKLGQIVKQGQLLIRLDDTTTGSSLGESQARSHALKAKVARLQVEIQGDVSATFACPEDLRTVSPEICANENELFSARRENFRNKLSVLRARQKQRMQELEEARTNVAQLDRVIAAVTRQRDTIEPLVKKRLHAETDLLRMETELAQQSGQLAVITQSIARLEAAVEEASLQIEELSLQFQQEARNEMSQVLADLGVLGETIRGASDRVRRTDIRSPVDGIINTLEINTIGAYVQPGAVVGGVVPTSDTLLVEARISPRDVAFVQRDQPALVKITAYDFSIYGGLKGRVVNVSADSLVDQESGETYYQVHVVTDEAALVKGGAEYNIMPGMVASVEIMTGQKTVLDYLLKPINKARSEALTER
jgi:membrane fusion protein, adhesin transport system